MIAQDHGAIVTEVGDQALLLVPVESDPLESVVSDTAVEEQGGLVERQKPFLKATDRHARSCMRVHDADGVGPGRMDRRVDDDARGVDRDLGAPNLVSVMVDHRKRLRSDFPEQVSVAVDQQVVGLVGQSRGNMCVDQVVHAEMSNEPVGRREILAHRRLGG